jgi:hypothetical protein
MKSWALLLAGLMLSGCTAAYKTDSFVPPSQNFDQAASTYVAVPEDGRYADAAYPGSGRQTALAMFQAVLMHTSRATVADTRQPHDINLDKAKALAAVYLFEATIINWEDRATEWSGLPDRLTLRIVAYDVASGRELTSSVLTSHSGWWTLGGDHPQDLLPETVKPFFDGVYGTASPAAPRSAERR